MNRLISCSSLCSDVFFLLHCLVLWHDYPTVVGQDRRKAAFVPLLLLEKDMKVFSEHSATFVPQAHVMVSRRTSFIRCVRELDPLFPL